MAFFAWSMMAAFVGLSIFYPIESAIDKQTLQISAQVWAAAFLVLMALRK